MNARTISGWVLSALISLFLIAGSATGKFFEWKGKDEMFGKFGVSNELMFKIGILEVLLAILFLVPRAGFLAAILLTGYLGGAVMTHVRVGDPFYMPIIIGVLVWVAIGLRQRGVFSLAFGTRPSPPAEK